MKKKNSIDENYLLAASLQELIQRYGNAAAEFFKGLRGIDYEIGISFDRSLLEISQYKTNPDYIQNNIKQQSGYAAEVAHVSRKNAESIISGGKSRFSRSEDIAKYGKNHNTVDIVEKTIDGKEITSQMKFVTDPKKLLDQIAKGDVYGGKKDLSRYMNVDRLDLPTEQVEEAKEYCREQVEKLVKQVKKLNEEGKTELAEQCKKHIENYKNLEQKITDSGVSSEEAIKYRLNPKWETAKDIADVSHRAGIEGAKFGAAIGGAISLISNAIAVHSGNKEFSDAIIDTTKDTLTSAGVGYATAFSGSAIKSVMQQSSSQVMRSLSKSGLPAMVISTCLAAGKSLYRYSCGEIDLTELFTEMGATANGMLSTATFSMVGQVAIPVPILGGLIGGMIGYTLTNSFYYDLINSRYDVNLARAKREIIEMQCAAAKELAEKYQRNIAALFEQKLIQLDTQTENLFTAINDPTISTNEFSLRINKFAELLGKDLPYKNQEEFDCVMLSSETLTL